jgi:serine protease
VHAPASLTYSWKRDGEAIPGGSSSVYVPTSGDVGKALTVTVVSKTPPFNDFPATSTATDPVPTGPAVSLSGLPTSTKYGVAGSTAKVTVDGVAPGGTVELRRGSDVLGSGLTDEDGVATIEIPGVKWVAGVNAVRGAFVGDGSHGPASSTSSNVTVSKASASVGTSLISKIRHTSHAKLSLTVKVSGEPHPSGSLKIYDGSHVIANSYLYGSGAGKKTISLPLLSKGTHSIRVRYAGNANINAKYSLTEKISSK